LNEDNRWPERIQLDSGSVAYDILGTTLCYQEARKAINWFKDMGWLNQNESISEAIAKGLYCKGCHGDCSIHWSADCWILGCCVDEKGLEHCDECDDFPCDKLVDWSKQSEVIQLRLRD